MRREAGEIVVDGEKYLLGDWPVDVATEVWAWLCLRLGPSIGPAFELIMSQGVIDKDVTKIPPEVGLKILNEVFTDLSRTCTPAEYATRMKQIFETGILHNNAPVKFNTHFARRLKHMHSVAFEVLKFQFGDFIEGLPLNFGNPKAAGSRPSAQVQ